MVPSEQIFGAVVKYPMQQMSSTAQATPTDWTVRMSLLRFIHPKFGAYIMTVYRNRFPDIETDLFLAYLGMETDLIFTQSINFPGFASYPLLETDDGRARLRRYFSDMIVLG